MITFKRTIFPFFFLLVLVLSSCSAPTPAATPQIVTVYSTSAASLWLSDLYACADSFAILSRVDDPSTADIVLRVGEPAFLDQPAFQIDEEEIVVIMNNTRPPKIDPQQIKGLFTGQITNWNQITSAWGEVHEDQSGDIHVWVYSSDNEIQQVFDGLILEGRAVTSSARLAVNPQEMLDAIQNDQSAIGLVNQRWNTDHVVFEQVVIAKVPVLALTKSEPAGVVKELMACMQK